ncbi:response regulator [Lysobacter sp. CFH 32150]|uniref:response regulator n=1 Tax=Lysobacter sp. CFH 32150 TaxID=2927128 RepID=UPI001FA6FBEB|nr:response regulator [Lysobacter sp. CFH 32150]MCI4567432.1 response regulator [Lysobacter sp. CFH 32150]
MKPRLPHILLVEDDPTSRTFLAAAAEALPAIVDTADSLATARALATMHAYDLWLIDANLPDGSGIELLQQLRQRAPTPALAHTAARDRSALDPLLDAGFVEALIKPLSSAQLQGALRRILGHDDVAEEATSTGCGKLPTWDEEAALDAMNGNRMHVEALRKLFLGELAAQRDAVLAGLQTSDDGIVHAQLHRLQASCSFVGAVRLGAAVKRLRDGTASIAARESFAHAAADTLASA